MRCDVYKISETPKESSRGVFWIIDNQLFPFPFIENDTSAGVSKSGLTYNHRLLWNEIRGKNGVPYNYYPRGRVDFNNKGKPIVYMNPNISLSFIPAIKREFSLLEEPKIYYDNSEHYKCYLDDGWKPDNI